MELMKNYIFMITFDALFSIFLVTNLVVVFWRIIWDVQDLYLTNENKVFNSVVSIVIYYVLILFVKLLHYNSVNDKLNQSDNSSARKKDYNNRQRKAKKSLGYKVKTKLFILVFAVANINHWRGIWYLTDYYTSDSIVGAITVGSLSLLSLIALKRVCVLISIPFLINKDSKQAAYQLHANTFKDNDYLNLDDLDGNSSWKPCFWLLIANYLLEYLSDVFTIQIWRSVWVSCDKYLFSNDRTLSALTCLLTGLTIYLFIHFFNRKIKYFILNTTKKPKYIILNINQSAISSTFSISSNVVKLYDNKQNKDPGNDQKEKKWTSFLNRLFLNLIFLLCFVGTVTVWRGLWMFQTDYMYPQLIDDSTEISNKMFLNVFYINFCILILWSINLISALLSRANCEDCYFLSKKNYVLKQNNFKTFFCRKNRRDVKQKINDSKHKWKMILHYYLFCNYFNKSDSNNKIRDFLHDTKSGNQKKVEQEFIEKV